MFRCKEVLQYSGNNLKKMSQKRPSPFSQPSRSVQRKHEEAEKGNNCDMYNDSGCGDAKNNYFAESSAIRAKIIQLSKCKPALSSNIGLTWFNALEEEFSKDYFKKLGIFLTEERRRYIVYPPEQEVYSWTNAVKITDIKVVILGQDPYYGINQAHGLAFSVRKGISVPRSLMNIYKELSTNIPEFKAPPHGNLCGWAAQGVLLLNSCLTVRARCPNSHRQDNEGWQKLTDAVITWINKNMSHVVFILWGGNAKRKAVLIDKNKHLLLTAAHPSPLSASRGFFGCQHFSKANDYLQKYDKNHINWTYLP